MKPYFFPGIFVSDELHEKLVRIFGSYIAIEPLNYERRENVYYLDSLTVNREEITKFINEYRYISEANPGIPKENLLFMRENIYFKDDYSKSSIRSEISGKKKSLEKNPVLNSSIFLQLSYEFEMSEYQIELKLKKAAEKESLILQKLKDQNFSLDYQSSRIDDRFDTKLQAWLTINNFSFISNLFVTTSHDILKYIEDNDYETFVIEDTDSLPGIIDNQYIENLTSKKLVGTHFPDKNLILYKIKISPEKLFEGFISCLPQSATNISEHTIICIID